MKTVELVVGWNSEALVSSDRETDYMIAGAFPVTKDAGSRLDKAMNSEARPKPGPLDTNARQATR